MAQTPLPPLEHTPLPHSPHPNHTIPTLGYGTCQTTHATTAALAALQLGYTHLDTAQIYANEAAIGSALSSYLSSPPSASTATSAPARSSLFITSKLWETAYTRAGALAAVRASCRDLQVDYLDLYLLHTPRPGPHARWQAWLGLQDAVAEGLVRAIGVSNWAGRHVEGLMAMEGVRVRPCVNQLEVHPWRQQRGVREWCAREGVVCVAYSPLGQGARLGEEGGVVKQVAGRVGRTEAQVVLRWALQRACVVVPKSERVERMRENMGVWGWELGEEEMAMLDNLDEGDEGATGEWFPEAWE